MAILRFDRPWESRRSASRVLRLGNLHWAPRLLAKRYEVWHAERSSNGAATPFHRVTGSFRIHRPDDSGLRTAVQWSRSPVAVVDAAQAGRQTPAEPTGSIGQLLGRSDPKPPNTPRPYRAGANASVFLCRHIVISLGIRVGLLLLPLPSERIAAGPYCRVQADLTSNCTSAKHRTLPLQRCGLQPRRRSGKRWFQAPPGMAGRRLRAVRHCPSSRRCWRARASHRRHR